MKAGRGEQIYDTLKQEVTNLSHWRIPSKLRLRFERELEGGTKGSIGERFKREYSKDIDNYYAYVRSAVEKVFLLREYKTWFHNRGIDIVTWHYKTRHTPFEAGQASEWFSGQVKFNPRFPKGPIEPFPEIKSPYIDIFGDEHIREKKGLGGPICVLLPRNSGSLEIPSEWNGIALIVPSPVTNLLKRFPEHKGEKNPLGAKHLKQVKERDLKFVFNLRQWMNTVSLDKVSDLKALNNLMASLKVTLRLLKDAGYRSEPPRSTFLCPAYVGGKEVGGMAFACRGFVSMETALIGEYISRDLLSYLRLREDALSHAAVEENTMLDQAKRFFIYRLAHDFRHPISALQSTVGELANSFNSIEKQMSHVSHMVDDTVLALEGRDPQKILRPTKSKDNVFEFLADVRFFFKRRFEEKKKVLELVAPNRQWSFNIDRGMVHEIMENLVANALEHGGSHVKIFVEKKREKYLIHVTDDGGGIPLKHKESVFRPFFGVAGSEGLNRGRGLAISRALAEAHNGNLRLESRRKPCDFVLEIPEH